MEVDFLEDDGLFIAGGELSRIFNWKHTVESELFQIKVSSFLSNDLVHFANIGFFWNREIFCTLHVSEDILAPFLAYSLVVGI